jgi:5-methylcytosine-specific restriction endonuclease McrA
VAIFERDGWKCGLCGDPVDSDLSYPHPQSASLDHIVPISRGGPHTYDNVQCAHLSCNRDKSDSVA